MSDDEVTSLVEGIREGDRRALARAITLTESTRVDHHRIAEKVLGSLLTETGNAVRIGISGSPGVGKSTFIEALGLHIVKSGHRLAVLAVDPSSRLTGGSILGDKTRMVELSRHPDAFIRPTPGGEQLGGVARRTREAMLLCEAAGSDVVMVETIGVGQSEITVAEMVDMFILLVAPGGGDDLQGIKRGIMELADLIVVNKADGDLEAAARRTAADYSHALKLMRPTHAAWTPEVLTCSALAHDGIGAVWDAIERFHNAVRGSGELERLRSAQAKAWMWSEIHDSMIDNLHSNDRVRALLPHLEADVEAGRTTPTTAARKVLDAISS